MRLIQRQSGLLDNVRVENCGWTNGHVVLPIILMFKTYRNYYPVILAIGYFMLNLF